jgi:probable HAF family extracellular repeat protein
LLNFDAGGQDAAMKMEPHMRTRTLAVVSILLCSTLAFAEDGFRGLGGVNSGGFRSAANGVSGDGSRVVGVSGNGAGFDGVMWMPGEVVLLGDLPGGTSVTVATGISPKGAFVVGQSGSANGSEALLWFKGGMKGLGDLPGPGAFASRATAVSSDGEVVVGLSQRPQSQHGYNAWRWTRATGMVDIGDLPGGDPHGIANDVSADGSVVVGSSSSSAGNEGFVWRAATGMIGIGDLPGGLFGSSAQGISADGTVVVGYGTGPAGAEAIRWTEEYGMVGLGDLPGGNLSSAASAASAHGNVIVGTGSTAEGYEAFLWTPSLGMVSLKQYLLDHGVTEVAGWTLSFANDVSLDGRTIVGNGINPSLENEAWVATIEPGAFPQESQESE